jgi:hypothetical protein
MAENSDRATSTWAGGSGLTVIYGVAAPVKAPLMVQVRQPQLTETLRGRRYLGSKPDARRR